MVSGLINGEDVCHVHFGFNGESRCCIVLGRLTIFPGQEPKRAFGHALTDNKRVPGPGFGIACAPVERAPFQMVRDAHQAEVFRDQILPQVVVGVLSGGLFVIR